MSPRPTWPRMAIGLLILWASTAAHAQMFPIAGEDDEPIPEPAVILTRVREAFPDAPVRMAGRLVRRASGEEPEREWRVVLLMDWNARPPHAVLHLADAFGTPIGTVHIRYEPGGAKFAFRMETEDGAQASPDVDAPILGTDFTWRDLSLSFLWWEGGQWRGFESRRGRRCYVIDIPSPEPTDDNASIRLWVDAHVYALLQAEMRNRDGKAVRRLSVRSLRRVGVRWTLEDLEMRTLTDNTRTLLHVSDLAAMDVEPVNEEP